MAPTSLEIHVTYKCDLKCQHCNRGVGMGIDHTPDLTIASWQRCLRGAPPLSRLKRKALGIYFSGGEPTLWGLEKIEAFIAATIEIAPRPGFGIFSNAATPRSRKILAVLAEKYGMRNYGSPKPGGGPDYAFTTTMFLSPVDTGMVREHPCEWAYKCGASVDEYGMTPCPIGGVIDGILKLGLRTWDWNELTYDRVMQLCAHCGRGLAEPPSDQIQNVRGFRMTNEWKDAVENWTP